MSHTSKLLKQKVLEEWKIGLLEELTIKTKKKQKTKGENKKDKQ